MNKTLPVDGSTSDGRIMVGLFTRAEYGPVVVVGIMRDGGAVGKIQRRAIDKQLVETVGMYGRP